MHIRKTKSGNYEAIVDVTPEGSPFRKQKSKTFKSKSKAKKWAKEKEVERDKGLIANDGGLTVKEFLLKWLEDYAEINLSPTTVNGYRLIIKRHLIPKLGHIALGKLNSRIIQAYEIEKIKNGRLDGKEGLSKKTVLQHHNVLSGAMNYAEKHDLINQNPCDKVTAPKARNKPMKHLKPKQVRKLLKKAKDKSYWHYVFFYLAVQTGARRSELMGLKWKNISFEDKQLTIRKVYIRDEDKNVFKDYTKNYLIRVLTLSDENIAVLKELKARQEKLKENKNYEDNDLVFAKDNGKPFGPDVPSNRFKSVAKKAGLGEFRLHDLRHTFATLSLEEEMPLKVVSERLGHPSVAFTLNMYSHVCN